MKLVVDLSPRWIAELGRSGQGLTFDCPHCVGADSKRVRLAVLFANPLDGGEPCPTMNGPGMKRCLDLLWNERDNTLGQDIVPPGTHWQRTGETFETMTLSPSVDASASGHWHGFIQGGEIR